MNNKILILLLSFIVLVACTKEEKKEINILFALSPACPMTAFYLQYLDSLEQKYSNKYIHFKYIVASKNHSKIEIDSFKNILHKKTIEIDKNNNVLHQLSVETVPSALIYYGKNKIYYGAIDNRAYAPGKLRQFTSEKYLETILDELITHRKISYNFKPPVGCILE